MRVLACQVAVPPIRHRAERDAHVAALVGRLSGRLARRPCDLVLLPELVSIDYSVDAFERLEQLAEPVDGPTGSAFAGLAGQFNCHVAVSFPRRAPDGFFISVLVLGADGAVIGTYDKMHIANFGASVEKPYFRPGENLLVFECAGLRCATVICYDFRFPELVRHLVLERDVEVILHPVAFKKDPTFSSWRSFVVCRALENQIYFLSLNRAGADYGGSILCPPWIDDDSRPVELGADEIFVEYELARAEIDRVRRTYPFRQDLGSRIRQWTKAVRTSRSQPSSLKAGH